MEKYPFDCTARLKMLFKTCIKTMKKDTDDDDENNLGKRVNECSGYPVKLI